MTTPDTDDAGLGAFKQRRLEAAAAEGQKIINQHHRAVDLLGRKFFGRYVKNVVSLDPEFGDNYIIEAAHRTDPQAWWVPVLDGKRIAEHAYSLDEALLIWLGDKHGDRYAAPYAARVIGLPDYTPKD